MAAGQRRDEICNQSSVVPEGEVTNKSPRDMTDTQFARLLKDLSVPVKIPEPVKEGS